MLQGANADSCLLYLTDTDFYSSIVVYNKPNFLEKTTRLYLDFDGAINAHRFVRENRGIMCRWPGSRRHLGSWAEALPL